ncbi:hypothetical protein MFLAVUS_008696 [Mucor flavus]|uniref:Uncharacterized protein n=1 Tax=Mucor flavus TaxID=439312 RepID=A0ABP9Z7U7_9FUNG
MAGDLIRRGNRELKSCYALETVELNASVNINISQTNWKTLSEFSSLPATFELEVGQKDGSMMESPVVSGDEYIYDCLERSEYSGLLKHLIRSLPWRPFSSAIST